MHQTAPGGSFLAEVMAQTPGGEALQTCLQCGTCGGSCPSGPDMDHTPRAVFALVAAGEREAVLKSNTPWYCVSCYYCMVRCPQEIPVTDVMYTLRRMSGERRGPRTRRRGRLLADLRRPRRALRPLVRARARRALPPHPQPPQEDEPGPARARDGAEGPSVLPPKKIRGLAGFKAILAQAKPVEERLVAASRGESADMAYGYYPGCSLEHSAAAYDDSTRAVARAMGVDLVELDDWNCCGATEYIAPEPHRRLRPHRPQPGPRRGPAQAPTAPGRPSSPPPARPAS